MTPRVKDAPARFPIAAKLFPLAVYMMLNGSMSYAFFAFCPVLYAQYMSEGFVTLVILFQPLAIILFSSFFGKLSDKIGNRKHIVLAGMVLKAGNFLFLVMLVSFDLASVPLLMVNSFLLGVSVSLGSCEGAWFSDYTYSSTAGGCLGAPVEKPRHTGISHYFLITSISWAVGSLSIGALIEATSIEWLPVISLLISVAGLVPLLFAKDEYKSKEGAKKSKLNIVRDLKALGRGGLIYPALLLRYIGLITSLSLIALVNEDLGLEGGISGLIISLNPIFQIAGMVITGAIVSRFRVKPLKLFGTGLSLTVMVLSFYTLGEGLQSGLFVILGQTTLGFAWSLVIIGFDEYIIQTVDWHDRAKYIGIRFTFMNIGKLSGMFLYFIGYELLLLNRLSLFTILVFFPLAGLVLVILARIKH